MYHQLGQNTLCEILIFLMAAELLPVQVCIKLLY